MNEKHIDFTTVREDLSVYEAENGQILKAKQIIVDIKTAKDEKGNYLDLGFSHVSATVTPILIDTSDLEFLLPEKVTEEHVIKELKFKIVKEIINIYETDESFIFCSPNVEKIFLTNKKDMSGAPILRYRMGLHVNAVPKSSEQTK